MTTERQFPPVDLALIKEAKQEASKQVPKAVARAIARQVRESVRTRRLAPATNELLPEISNQLSMAVLGERNYVSAYAAGQLKEDLGRRGIQVSEAQAGDIFHKALIAGAAATVAATGVTLLPQFARYRNFGIVPGGVFTTGSEVVQTGLLLPLVRERKRRTLMSIAAQHGCVSRNKKGQITSLHPHIRVLARKIATAVKQGAPGKRVRSLRAEFEARVKRLHPRR